MPRRFASCACDRPLAMRHMRMLLPTTMSMEVGLFGGIKASRDRREIRKDLSFRRTWKRPASRTKTTCWPARLWIDFRHLRRGAKAHREKLIIVRGRKTRLADNFAG